MNRDQFFKEGIGMGLSDEQILSAWKDVSPAEVEQPSQIKTNEQLREGMTPDQISVVDNSTDPNAVLSKQSVDDYFSGKGLKGDSLNIGRWMYGNNKMGLTELQAKLIADEQNGELENRTHEYLERASGVPYERIESTYEQYGPAMGEFVMGAESLGLGIAKAYANLGAGIGEIFTPEGLEKPFKAIREDTRWISENQHSYLESLLEGGDYDRFMRASTYNIVGDMGGQLALLGQSMKLANGLLGTKAGIVSKGKKWGELAKNTAVRAGVIGAMNWIQSDQPLEEKWKAFQLTQFYMNSPSLSGLMKSNGGAIVADLMINSTISALYDPEKGMQLGGQYKEAIQRAKDRTEEIGDPDAYNAILFAELLPITGSDIAFSTLTRSVRAQQRGRARTEFTKNEGVKRIHKINSDSFGEFKTSMEGKYGKEWLSKMDDVDRVDYKNRRQVNEMLSRGELPPALQEISKVIELRVNPAEMARKLQEDESFEVGSKEFSWRDKDGKLVTGDGVVRKTPEGIKYIEPSKGAEAPKGEPKDVPDREVSLEDAMKDLETVMRSDKATEVITTDADVGTGIIKDTMRLGQKESVALTPPELKSKNFEPWLTEQIVHISRLMEMGGIKTKKDYNEYLDTYTQRGDMDSDMVYREARAHQKSVAKLMKDAEKKSARAKITQKQFKPEKQMVFVDSMEIIKDRIRSIQEGVALGKKITKEKQRELNAARKEVVSEAEKIVNDMTKDRDIRNRFKLMAQKAVKTDKSLASFIDKFTKFVSEDINKRERKQLLKGIMKDPSSSVHAEYAEAIVNLRDMINTDTSAKSQWRLESQRQALEKNSDINLPEKVLQKLSQTKIEEISTEDLRSISEEVARLTDIGKTKKKIVDGQFKKDVASSISKIRRTAKQAPVQKYIDETKQVEKFTGLKMVFGRGALRPWNLMDILDGGKATYNGEAHRVFIDDANVAHNRVLDMADTRLSGGEAIIRANKMRINELNKKFKFGKHKLSLDQMLSVYASSKNKLMHNAVLQGNFDGNKDVYNQIVEHVGSNPRLKSLADYIIYDYANNYDRMRKAVIRNENKILGQEENYVPMERVGVDRVEDIDQIAADLAGREAAHKSLPDNSFTIDRKNIPEEYQKRIKLGLYDQWERNVNRQERYINLFKQVQKMNSILADEGLSTQIRDAYGDSMNEVLKSYVKAYSNPMSMYATGRLAEGSRKLRKNIAMAYLSYNGMTMLKQLPSALLYAGQGGGKNLLVAFDDFNGSWRMEGGKPVNDLIRFVEGKDPQIKHAHIERELTALKDNNKAAYEKLVGKISEPGMKGIVSLDKMARTVGWYSTYLKSLESGKTEAQAIKDAGNATLRTQPAASAKDLPHLYREVSPWFTMFSNQINQIWNVMGYQLPKSVANQEFGSAIAMFGGLMANAVVFHTLQHGAPPQNDEEFKRMLIEQSAGKVPLVGSPLTASLSGYDAESPAVGIVTDVGKTLMSDDPEKTMKAISKAAATATGLPVTAGRRVSEFAEEGDIKDLFGVK